jgi:hypothetical protein
MIRAELPGQLATMDNPMSQPGIQRRSLRQRLHDRERGRVLVAVTAAR